MARGRDQSQEPEADAGSGRDDAGEATPFTNVCLRCGAELESMGIEEFRVGGTSGGWKLLFGEWAELGEGKVPLEVWACPVCRMVEFRVPQQ